MNDREFSERLGTGETTEFLELKKLNTRGGRKSRVRAAELPRAPAERAGPLAGQAAEVR